jgi:D-glycero-D-manno-heptose 1,7-bisphosphate phosphatase
VSAPRVAADATVFLDRDGTINQSPPEGDYLSSPAEVALIHGAAAAIRRLREHGTRVVVVTNQRGIALGRMTEGDYAAVTERLLSDLAAAGARVDAVFHCPHHAESCDCRKPGPGMFERAAREVPGVMLTGAAMVGDSALDIEAGNRLGLTTVRLGATAEGEPRADHEVADLPAAVSWLLGDDQS